jgi:hypothetical protein
MPGLSCACSQPLDGVFGGGGTFIRWDGVVTGRNRRNSAPGEPHQKITSVEAAGFRRKLGGVLDFALQLRTGGEYVLQV